MHPIAHGATVLAAPIQNWFNQGFRNRFLAARNTDRTVIQVVPALVAVAAGPFLGVSGG